MALIYHELNIPLDTDSTFDYIVIKQGDAGSHKVRATLINNNSVFTIPTSNATYYFKFRKPDNTYVLVQATVSNNQIIADVTEEMLRVAGTGRGEFMIVQGSTELKTATFYFKIVQQTYTTDDVISSSDFATFASLLAGAGKAASNANAAAAAANTAAANAAAKADLIPDDYTELVQQVEDIQEELENLDVETDATLTEQGKPADAKATGDKIAELNGSLENVETGIFTVSDNLFNIDDIYTNKVPGSVGSSYDAMVALNGWYTSNYIPVTEGEQYALVYLSTITQGVIFRIVGYSNGIMTYKTSGSTEPNPLTIPSGVDHVRFYSNTANLFNKRTNTSFKKYSAGMSMAWAPYGKQENFLVKGAMPEYGVYVDGTNYYHFVHFGEKTLIRLFKQEGPNNLFQFSGLYTGEISEHGASIDKTIATNGTDTVGPISIMRQGVDSSGMWTGGWHTRTVNGVVCPTAEQQSLDIRINGKSIVGADGLHYGECVATVVNKLYFAQTITGADLSMATQAIQETVTYILNEKMTARVAHKYVADTRVILYYGMQAVRIGFDNIILPNNETAFTFADMTANINLGKPEDLIQMSNNDWNYDLLVKPFGLAKYTHNSGAGSTKYGYLPTATRKVYWVLMEGTYDYTFITSGKVLVWEGVWDIYPN